MISTSNRRVFVAALLVGGGFLASKITGILDDLILAKIIGPGPQLDAYYAAFGLPDLLFTLIAGGALAAAFIPVFSERLTNDDHAGAWKLASAVINTAFVVALAASAVLALTAPWIVRETVGAGFVPDQQLLSANLMRVILIGTVIFSVSGIVMSALQANQHFLLPALAPVMYNLGILAGVIFLAPRIGVWGPTLGVVAGALLHLLIQVPGLIKYKARWTLRLGWRDPALRRVLRLMAPRIAGLGVVQVAAIVATSLASTLSAGSVTALNYGWRVMQLPETLIATAIATAAFPTLSEFAARGQIAELRATLSSTLRGILFLTVPAAIALLVRGQSFVRILFERGRLTPEDTILVKGAVQGYDMGLIAQASLEVSARAFYAQQNAIVPLAASFVATIIFLILAVGLGYSLGAGGVALSNGLAYSDEATLLWYLLNRRFAGVMKVHTTLVRAIPVAVSGGLLVYGLMRLNLPVSELFLGVLALGMGGLLVLPFILPELRLLLKM